jgi:hypothetical protein
MAGSRIASAGVAELRIAPAVALFIAPVANAKGGYLFMVSTSQNKIDQ